MIGQPATNVARSKQAFGMCRVGLQIEIVQIISSSESAYHLLQLAAFNLKGKNGMQFSLSVIATEPSHSWEVNQTGL